MKSLRTAVAILVSCAWTAAQAESMAWALAYDGKDHPFLLYDPKVVRLISRDLGIAEDSDAMAAFLGVPSAVNVVERRYVWSSSCQAHQCPFNRGFFWLDTAVGETLAARNVISYPKRLEYRERGVLMLREQSELTIGGSAPSVQTISREAMQSLRNWIAANNLRFDSVTYRSNARTGNVRETTLEPAEYSAPANSSAER